MNQHFLMSCGLSLALAAGAWAQGDTCANTPTPLVGSSPFAFDTTGLSNSVSQSPASWEATVGCAAGIFNSFHADGFWVYTATASGLYDFEIIAMDGGDSQLALYSFTDAGDLCNTSACLGADDDSGTMGTLLSKVSGIPLQTGDDVLVQIGGYQIGDVGMGMLEVTFAADPCPASAQDSFAPNSTCIDAATIGDGTLSGLWSEQGLSDYFVTCVAPASTLSASLDSAPYGGAAFDLVMWDAASTCAGTRLAGSAAVSSMQSVSWTNPGPDPVTVVIEAAMWTDVLNLPCDSYDLTLSGSGGGTCPQVIGTFCDPANPNSTSQPCVLSGTFQGLNSTLHLEATDGPPGTFGFFLIGSEGAPIVLQSGNLCLFPFHRYSIAGSEMNSVGVFDGAGVMQNLVGTSSVGSGFDVPATIPTMGSPTIMAGETFAFQVYYRDGNGPLGANLSNGLTVTF